MGSVPRHKAVVEVLHCYDPDNNHDKVYVIWIENRGGDAPFYVCGAYGSRTIKGMLKVDPKGSFSNLNLARAAMDSYVNIKRKKGYLEIESAQYIDSIPASVKVTFDEIVRDRFIDTSRIIGISTGTTVAAPAPLPVSSKRQHTVEVGSGRVKRRVEL